MYLLFLIITLLILMPHRNHDYVDNSCTNNLRFHLHFCFYQWRLLLCMHFYNAKLFIVGSLGYDKSGDSLQKWTNSGSSQHTHFLSLPL